MPPNPRAMSSGMEAWAARGKSGKGEAEKTVKSGLQEQAGQIQAAGRGGLGVGVGQPGMQGHDGNFDGKRQHKGRIEQNFRGEAKVRVHQLRKRKGIDPGLLPMEHIEGHQGDEHRADCRTG